MADTGVEKQGNALSVDQLRRMMLVFDASYYKKSLRDISEEFTKSFSSELAPKIDSDDDVDIDNEYDRFNTLREASPSVGLKSNEHFRFLLASTLITLLNDRFNSQRRLQSPANRVINHGFFKPLQRLIALYLVYNLYKHKPIGHHPFLPNFMEIIENCPKDKQEIQQQQQQETEQKEEEEEEEKKKNKRKTAIKEATTMTELIFIDEYDSNILSKRFGPLCDKIEAEFIVKLLFNRDIDKISKMSAIEFTRVYCDKLINNKMERWPEFAQIQQLISGRHNKNFQYSPLKTLGLNPILRDYDLNLDLKLAPFAMDNNIISDISLNGEFSNYSTFDPEIVRPRPPFMIPFGKHELRWQFLGDSPKLIWDTNQIPIGIKHKLSSSDLMNKALKNSLNEQEQILLINEIKSIQSFKAFQSLLPSSCLNLLCSFNPQIVIQIFLILKTNKNQQIMNEYLNGLCNLNVADVETAQNSMNLMKQIAEKIKIPKKYIVQFISHCIKTCEDTKEPFHQTRLVRYISIFVQELIIKHIISIKDVAVETQAFCLEFSRIPEATKLYKLLKQQNINNDDNDDNDNDDQ